MKKDAWLDEIIDRGPLMAALDAMTKDIESCADDTNTYLEFEE